MKFGELLDRQIGYDIYDFGHQMYIKLFDEPVSYDWIKSEYEKSKVINEVYHATAHVDEIVQVETRHGITFVKEDGESLLYILEHEPLKLKEVTNIFAKTHAAIHQVHIDDIIDQKSYYKEQITTCKSLNQHEKDELLSLLESLPTDNVLCHGNYHLNNVITGKRLLTLGYGHAYKGHPMSDVAKACIIIEIPRRPEGASNIFIEELVKMKHQALLDYIEVYQSIADYDEVLLDKFLKLAAVSRLNEEIEYEEEWLLNIVRN